MASRNPDSLTNAQGEFTPHKPRSEPLETGGHQPGVKSTPADHAPDFSIQTLPAGTAPPESTYAPNPEAEVPGQANNDHVLRSHAKEGVRTDALSTFPGATSADVHQGLGHPGQGQTSSEIRHGGPHTSKKQTSGLEGVGATGKSDSGSGDNNNPLPEHNATLAGAESKLPVSASELAAEGDSGRR